MGIVSSGQWGEKVQFWRADEWCDSVTKNQVQKLHAGNSCEACKQRKDSLIYQISSRGTIFTNN